MIESILFTVAVAMLEVYADPPPGSEVHEITIDDNGQHWVVYGYVEDDSDWDRLTVPIILDMPGDPRGTVVVKKEDIVEHHREPSATRDKRIEAALEQAGLEAVGNLYVSSEERDLADRARRMAQALDADETAPAAPPEGEPLPRPGLLALWGPHAGVGVVTVALLALIWAGLFRNK